MEVDGKFVRSDGFPTDPLNAKRVINVSKLCDDVLEAKNFNFFPEDIQSTKNAFPKGSFFDFNFEMIYDKEPRHI